MTFFYLYRRGDIYQKLFKSNSLESIERKLPDLQRIGFRPVELIVIKSEIYRDNRIPAAEFPFDLEVKLNDSN